MKLSDKSIHYSFRTCTNELEYILAAIGFKMQRQGDKYVVVSGIYFDLSEDKNIHEQPDWRDSFYWVQYEKKYMNLASMRGWLEELQDVYDNCLRTFLKVDHHVFCLDRLITFNEIDIKCITSSLNLFSKLFKLVLGNVQIDDLDCLPVADMDSFRKRSTNCLRYLSSIPNLPEVFIKELQNGKDNPHAWCNRIEYMENILVDFRNCNALFSS